MLCMQGESSDYGAVIEHLSASQMKADGMKRWLQALQLCVSQLGKEHDRLVSTTLVWRCSQQLIMKNELQLLSLTAEILMVQSKLWYCLSLHWLPDESPLGSDLLPPQRTATSRLSAMAANLTDSCWVSRGCGLPEHPPSYTGHTGAGTHGTVATGNAAD